MKPDSIIKLKDMKKSLEDFFVSFHYNLSKSTRVKRVLNIYFLTSLCFNIIKLLNNIKIIYQNPYSFHVVQYLTRLRGDVKEIASK